MPMHALASDAGAYMSSAGGLGGGGGGGGVAGGVVGGLKVTLEHLGAGREKTGWQMLLLQSMLR